MPSGSDTSHAVTVVTTAPLRAPSAQAAATALSIARGLHKRSRLARVVCPDYDAEEAGLPEACFSTPGSRRLQAAVSLLLSQLGRVVAVPQRRLREEVFDRAVSLSGALRGSETVLFLKPVFPLSASAARRRGSRTFALATIQHPALNQARVAREQELRGCSAPTSYTDAARVQNISVFLESLDFLLSRAEGSERSYVEHGMPPEKIFSVGPTGVDCDKFRPNPAVRAGQTFRVLHLSHMNLIKGLGYLFEAWKKLDLPGAELVLGGPMDEDVRRLLAELDPPNVVLLGSVADPAGEYQRADLFVSPSVSDMGPATVLESMACGTPVVVSDGCGVHSIVSPGRDGFVYRYDLVDELAGRLRECFADRERLAQMGLAARETALRYPRESFGERVVSAIDELQDSP
jgi:glycosyltransferase involved in cell wall biosynthesis